MPISNKRWRKYHPPSVNLKTASFELNELGLRLRQFWI